MLLLLSMGTLACLGGAWITCTILIFRLRARFPDVYAKVGSPNAFTRKVDFLWALKPFEAEIGPDLQKLQRTTLIYVGLLTGLALLFIVVAVGSVILPG